MISAQFIALVALAGACAQAQWQMQTSNTTADLRGIHSVGNGVAWASGTNGTVLRTEDGGYVWQTCTVPPGAEKLDFRGIQAFDANTAIVMSSGKGDVSRLYKTTDGCHTWWLLLTNPDADGFWDGLAADKASALVIGDPVNGHFAVFASFNSGHRDWYPFAHPERAPTIRIPPPHSKEEALFAASNSILLGEPWNGLDFVTGGSSGSYLYMTKWHSWPADHNFATFEVREIPVARGASAGAFSFTTSPGCDPNLRGSCAFIVVGGDYMKPDDSTGTAAYSKDDGRTWKVSRSMPHGYRSSVAYDSTTKTWITVGPNGTDISTEDGRNWRPIHPNAALHETPDADRNWNAISLPYVVGPKGRIGKLDEAAIAK
jgi:photosystem II stability/assembly factor-like uncharacterized protein